MMTSDYSVRVLHIIHRMRPGGVQGLVMNLYRHIDRTKVQFDFAVRAKNPEYYDEEILSLGGRIFHLPWQMGNPLSTPFYKSALRKVLHDYGPFVAIHSHAGPYSGLTLPVANKSGIPLRLAHSHSTATGKESFVRNLWVRLMRHYLMGNATDLLACSKPAALWLYGKQAQEDPRLLIFPNAIDLTRYSHLPKDRHDLRQKLSLPAEGVLIGHVGRFNLPKNHHFLLKVFRKFSEVQEKTHLVLVGEGDLHSEIELLAQNLQGKVHFLGARSDVPQVLAALDLFVFPSLFEGLGIVLVEAQAAGIPCVASDVVPNEADIGLGLVKFVSLEDTVEHWGEFMLDALKVSVPCWAERKKALQAAGYDVQSAADRLQDIYVGD
jgi:glycosyltransferase involved in cell wall biosynthesis